MYLFLFLLNVAHNQVEANVNKPLVKSLHRHISVLAAPSLNHSISAGTFRKFIMNYTSCKGSKTLIMVFNLHESIKNMNRIP